MARYPAHHTKIRAAKAWAGILSARLGLIQPNVTTTVHRRSTAERYSRENKTARAGRTLETLAHFFTSSPPPSSPERASEAAVVATGRRVSVMSSSSHVATT
jgi:hypothetical protein